MIILLTWLTFLYMNHSSLYKISIDFYMIISLQDTNSKYIQMSTKKQRRQLSSLHSELETLIGQWNVYADCETRRKCYNDWRTSHMAKLLNINEEFCITQKKIQSFKIFFIPRYQSTATDSLYRTARSFHSVTFRWLFYSVLAYIDYLLFE